jgi:hypothetical protein
MGEKEKDPASHRERRGFVLKKPCVYKYFTYCGGLKMAKPKNTLWAVVVLFLIMATTPAFSDEGPITKLFFKSGTVMQCDQVWEGLESNILCKKSRGVLAYSPDEVDLVKTFGEADGKEIAARYERIIKEKELSSKPIIITLAEERAMRKREREESKVDKPARLTKKELEKMFKHLPTAAEARARGVSAYTREEAIANYLAKRARYDYELAGRKELEKLRKAGQAKGTEISETGPATSSIIESKVDGEFEGWDGDTVVKLTNGQIWHQTDFHISVTIKIMPDVLVYRSGSQWKMKVEGTRKAVAVERLR